MARMDKRVKKANKKATKGRKILRKGQAASYNPAFNKHRLEAKKRVAFGSIGTCNLTEAKLAQFNKITSTLCDDNEDLMSIGDTAVTAFTNSSLPTFNRLLQNWNAGSFLHKEMLAVLAAVADVIKTNGGKESETEYFAALMTTLDVVENDEGVTAVVCLLHMVIKSLNDSILKLHCKTASETFVKLLIKYMNTDHCALLKNLLNILYAFLKITTHWADFEGFKVLLEFTTHHKPKVRRIAHQIVQALLVDHIPWSSNIHPGTIVTVEFCIQKLEHNGGPAASREVFYILSLLQDIIGILPKASIKVVCETVLKVMTLSNAMVTSSCLKTLQGLFIMKPNPENLPVDLNARIIQALYDYQPNVKDTHSLSNWLQLMESAFINLNMLDSKLCYGHLPKFYSVAIKCWQTDSNELMLTVALTLKNILYKCIDPASEVFQQYLLEDPINNPPHKMFHFVEEALSYQYHKAWKHVLNLIAVFFEVIGKHCYTVMLKCLGSLADLHDSYKFPYISELEKAVGIAIQHIGPHIVLKAIPLKMSEESDQTDFPRSWLLPLLRDYVKKTELQCFIKYFLPLAAKVRNKVLSLQQEGKIVESKLHDVICSQIWSLLPGFCTEPTDLKQCFRDVARTLGIILKDEPSLRMTVLSSLRLLINKNINNEENKEEIARFGKNYLPILFNLYTTEPKDKSEERTRLAVYETCKSYLRIINPELCHMYFAKSLEKLMVADQGNFMQNALIDLCKALLPYVNESSVQQLYEYCKPLLKDANHTIQKRAYGVMNELCSSQSEICIFFVKDHLGEMRSLFSGPASGLTPSSKALRSNCLKCIVNQLTEDKKDFIAAILPEAVLCTKENSIKARTAAYSLLVEIGFALKRWQSNQKALKEYMKLLLAGLVGTPHMMSATILAIGRVMYEFKDDLDSDLIHLLIENMCLLITSRSREVVMSALSFMKILFSTVDTLMLGQHVEYMVKSITHISENNQRHFRFKAKEILTRLVRKFGYEWISKLVPENYQKQVVNIRKQEARKAHKKHFAAEESDSELEHHEKFDVFESILGDSEDEMSVAENKKQASIVKKKKQKNIDPWIEEHDENDIVDFMDPAVNKRLLTAKPEKISTVKKTAHSFPVSEDGRIIIQDEDTPAKSKRENEMNEKGMVMAELGASTKKRKRRFEDSDSDNDEDENEPSKVQSVKRGIHRTIGPKQKKKFLGEDYKAKNARGDVKKGKYEPYAYVPLNRQVLNRRKQVKLKGQFKNVVRAAKRGAIAGVKRKARDTKKRKGAR